VPRTGKRRGQDLTPLKEKERNREREGKGVVQLKKRRPGRGWARSAQFWEGKSKVDARLKMDQSF